MRRRAVLVLLGVACSPSEDRPPDIHPVEWTGAGGGASTSGGDASAGGAAGAPTYGGKENPVMMQAFYWNVPSEGGWWNRLAAISGELAASGIDAVWIPPPYKGKGGTSDVGYGVYDRYDLGEFDQKGSVATRYGTLAELEKAILALHTAGVDVYADMVMNHMMGGDEDETFTMGGSTFTIATRFTFAGRAGAYSTFEWNHEGFNGCRQGAGWTQWHPWDFTPYSAGDAWDNLLGCEIRFADAPTGNEMIAWGKWLTSTLALDGYRLDATKHMLTSFVVDWLDEVKGERFAVSESWMSDVERLAEYAEMTGGKTTLFDVPLHYRFYEMSEGDGAWDMRGLAHAGFVETHGPLAVTFVDNHDTDNAGGLHSPVTNFKMLAYAHMLTRAQGYPCVFYKDWYESGFGDAIRTLIGIRDAHAWGPGVEHDESDQDVYVYSRLGDDRHSGLVLVLNDGPVTTKTVATPFARATLADATGNHRELVNTDASGIATLPAQARSYAVWVHR